MYYMLLGINQLLLIYFFATLIAPKKTLFFVKNVVKRKRIPYSLVILGVYVVFFIVCAPIIDDTPERKAERAKIEQEKAIAAQDSINQRNAEIRDSILHKDLDALAELEKVGALSKTGPDNAEWRRQQLLFAQRDSVNLVWASAHIHSSISGESMRANRTVKEIAKVEWRDDRFMDYYTSMPKGGNPTILNDSKRLGRLLKHNHAMLDSLTMLSN